MPTSPVSRCCEPGCTELTPRGLCDAHKRVTPPTEIRHNRGSETVWGPGSTRRHRRIRAAHFARHPECAHCGAPVAELDHVIPLALDGDRWSPENLQGLCVDCHRAKSAREAGLTHTRNQGGPRVRTYRVDNRVVVVSGPPCGGKTAYVAEHRLLYDLVWDDGAVAEALGAPGEHAQPHYTPFVAELREALFARLTRKHSAPRVWVITTDPRLADRLVGAHHVRVHATRDECMARMVTDHRPHRWVGLIDAWFQDHGAS